MTAIAVATYSMAQVREPYALKQRPKYKSSTSTSVRAEHEIAPWWDSAISRVNDLLALKKGWDGHNGQTISSDTILFASELLAGLSNAVTPKPQIVPLPYGGVQLEWHGIAASLEIEVISPYHVAYFFEDHATGRQEEGDLESKFGQLNRLMNQLLGSP